MPEIERCDTIVIGAGQAGLAVGYFLKRLGRDFIILDANARIGDSWRQRWDSLRLFTPAKFDGLAGMRFPAPANSFPTKDAMAEYLEAYAARFNLPVRMGARVERLTREGEWFVVEAGERRYEANNVVVAMSTFQQPQVPAFAADLDPAIVQLHSSAYRHPAQLREGNVLIVGASNSGAEIARELAPGRHVWMAGRNVGEVPFRVDSLFARFIGGPVGIGLVFHYLLTVDTPLGRRARRGALGHGAPLIRVKARDLAELGVKRVPRIEGARDGLPMQEDGHTLDVANIIWCTGYTPGFSWIDLPVFGEREPLHEKGIVPSEPGLYFVGLNFLYAFSSTMIRGVSRDAERIARAIATQSGGGRLTTSQIPAHV